VIQIERERLLRRGRPELASKGRKPPARGPDRDISTPRRRDDAFRKHDIEVETSVGVELRGTITGTAQESRGFEI